MLTLLCIQGVGVVLIVLTIFLRRDGLGVSAHEATTAHVQALYPFMSSTGLGSDGVYIGAETTGGSFFYDPWSLYERNIITNPNMVIAGQVGRGKSALIKTIVYRQAAFGRTAIVVDPKGEWAPLCERLGGTVLRLAPGNGQTLNPLDPGELASSDPGSVMKRQDRALSTLAQTALGRRPTPEERSAMQEARQAAAAVYDQPTIVNVVEFMLEPTEEMARNLRTDVEGLAARSRQAALELRRLVEGDLSGMFDGETNVEVDWLGPMVVLDLSALGADDEVMGLVMACCMAWLQGALARPDDNQKRILVLDEAWRLLSDLALARWLRSMFKFSRQFGLSNVMVLHRMSDLESAGGAGSEVQGIARGLLSDTETRVIYNQPVAELKNVGSLLGLTGTELDVIKELGRGVALWKVKTSTFVVRHVIGDDEWPIIDTDSQMRVTTDEDRDGKSKAKLVAV